jgi:hypothetical protein
LNNIEMDLRGIGWGDIDWIDLAQDRDKCRAFVNVVMSLWDFRHSDEGLDSIKTDSQSVMSLNMHTILRHEFMELDTNRGGEYYKSHVYVCGWSLHMVNTWFPCYVVVRVVDCPLVWLDVVCLAPGFGWFFSGRGDSCRNYDLCCASFFVWSWCVWFCIWLSLLSLCLTN